MSSSIPPARTRVWSSGSGASKSSSATVGAPGAHSRALIHAWFSFGISPSRIQPPTCRDGSTKSKYQLSLHSVSSVGGWRPSSSALGCNGSGVLGAGRMASASVSSTCWQFRAIIAMNISSPRSVRSTSIGDTMAISTPKKLW